MPALHPLAWETEASFMPKPNVRGRRGETKASKLAPGRSTPAATKCHLGAADAADLGALSWTSAAPAATQKADEAAKR